MTAPGGLYCGSERARVRRRRRSGTDGAEAQRGAGTGHLRRRRTGDHILDGAVGRGSVDTVEILSTTSREASSATRRRSCAYPAATRWAPW